MDNHTQKLLEVFSALSRMRDEVDNQEGIYDLTKDRYDLGIMDGIRRSVIILESFLKLQNGEAKEEAEQKEETESITIGH